MTPVKSVLRGKREERSDEQMTTRLTTKMH